MKGRKRSSEAKSTVRKVRLWSGILSALALWCFSAASPAGPPTDWNFLPFDKALQLAKQEQRLVFLYFGRQGCPFCAKTNRESFTDARVIEKYNANYVLAYVDSESGNSNYDRWVNFYSDTNGLADKSLNISSLVPVTAGEHTVYLVGEVYSGSCTITVYDSTLTVLLLPGQVFLPLVSR